MYYIGCICHFSLKLGAGLQQSTDWKQEWFVFKIGGFLLDDSKDVIDHETTNKLEYLEAAIEENMRLYPPVTLLDRTCGKDVKIGNIQFKKGVEIVIPIWAVHHKWGIHKLQC